jgi:hypothetical protein
MAHCIKAINAYRPRIEQGNTVQKPELVRALSRSTGLVEGSIKQDAESLRKIRKLSDLYVPVFFEASPWSEFETISRYLLHDRVLQKVNGCLFNGADLQQDVL